MKWLKRIFARRQTPAAERPRYTGLTIGTSDAGELVTYDKALTLSTVWACVRAVVESISSLPWGAFERTELGRDALRTHPAHRLLSVAPNPEMICAVWREYMVKCAMLWGNGYSEIEFDDAQRPIALWPLPPDVVEPVRTELGIVYLVHGQAAAPVPLLARQVFHLRGLGDDLAGYSVIRYGAQSLGLSLAENQQQGSFTRNASRPLGIITPVGEMHKDTQAAIEESFAAQASGKNTGRTIVLPQALDYKPLSLPNTDAQTIESRRWSTLEICRLFKVPPHKVAELQFATFSNITHQSLEFVRDSLMPWIVKLEQEADRRLISPSQRGKVYTRINANGLLRGDFETRTKSYQLLLDRGVFSINDVLELEDRNTLGPEGDAHFVPLNMQTLEQALQPPEPPPPPPAPPGEGDEGDDEGDEGGDLASPPPIPVDRLRPAVRDAVVRIVNRQINAVRARSVAKRRENLGDSFVLFCQQQITPLVPLFELQRGVSMAHLADDLAAYAASVLAEYDEAAGRVGMVATLCERWLGQVDRITDDLMGEVT